MLRIFRLDLARSPVFSILGSLILLTAEHSNTGLCLLGGRS